MSTTVLITGANRGLGKGLVEVFLSRPDHTVIAAVRDASASKVSGLHELKKDASSKLIIVEIDSSSETDPATAIADLEKQGISHLDIVIANAGISDDFSAVSKVPLDVVKKHISVNAYGPLLLFQAVLPLLDKSSKPIFTTMGSAMGTITAMDQRPFPSGAYGPSKALLHWYTRKMHYENEKLIVFVSDPGFAQTDMGNSGARAVGMEKAYTPVEECIAGLVKIIDSASRESHGGKNLVWDGSEFPF